MLFSSLTFLLYFLPIFFLIYALVPFRFKNLILLLGSLIFYGFTEPAYILLILFEASIAYFSAIWISRTEEAGKRKWIFAGSIAIYVLIFVFFKYSNFILENISFISGQNLPLLDIILPLGISFYTFQIISYEADVYQRKALALHSWIDFTTYICMFPQLIAGPIVRYTDISDSLKKRTVSSKDLTDGICRFCCGLSKKVLLANQLFAFCETFRTTAQISVLYCWLNALCILLYTYFDFSGYSDMAIGLGKMLGFRFPENFNYPFTASSITGFWRRWHMSLTTWFKDYVYIPLGGNRVSVFRQIRNLLIVWLFTGLWHGADWTFVLWGLIFFILLVLEKFVFRIKHPVPLISHIYVWIVLLLTFLLFNDVSIGQFVLDVKNLFGFGSLNLTTPLTLYALRSNLVLIILCLIGSTRWPKTFWEKITRGTRGIWIRGLGVLFVLVLSIAYIIGGSFNPFLYFRF